MTRPPPDQATRAPLDRDPLSTIDLATGEPRPLSDDEYTEIPRGDPKSWTAAERAAYIDHLEAAAPAGRVGPYDPTAEWGSPAFREPRSQEEADARAAHVQPERDTNPVPDRVPPEWSAQGAAEREDAHEADLERLGVEESPRPLGVPRTLTEVEAAGDDAAGQPRHHVHAALLGRAPSAAAEQGRTTGHGDYPIPALPDRSEPFVGASRGEQTRDAYEVAEPAAGELEIEDEEFEP